MKLAPLLYGTSLDHEYAIFARFSARSYWILDLRTGYLLMVTNCG
jgi:hypothetical protein